MPRWMRRLKRYIRNKYRRMRGRNEFTDPAIGMYYI
jgi:hypothetical protein